MVQSIHRKKLNLNKKAHYISNTEFYELDVFPQILNKVIENVLIFVKKREIFDSERVCSINGTKALICVGEYNP